MATRRKAKVKDEIDDSVYGPWQRKGERRYAWSINPVTFEPEFFDPDAPGTYAPAPLIYGWPRTMRDAQQRARSDLLLKRRALNRAIRELDKAMSD